jgi:hypothetical protein
MYRGTDRPANEAAKRGCVQRFNCLGLKIHWVPSVH